MDFREADLGRRRTGRATGHLVAWLFVRGQEHPVKLLNMSALGAMVETDLALEAAEDVQFLHRSKILPAQVVWTKVNRAGLEFSDPARDRKIIDALTRSLGLKGGVHAAWTPCS